MKKSISTTNKVRIGKALSQFIENEDFAVDVKDCAGKYTENNRLATMVSGLEPQDRIGMDIYDIGRINRMPSTAIERIVSADRNVSLDKAPISLVHTFLDKATHLIVVDKVVKQAVVNDQDQMIGILSYAQNIVPYINRTYLYALYQYYYTEKEAIQKFLEHMGIATFFIKAPVDKELSLLLQARHPIEALSQVLQLSLDDIHSYQASIQAKLAMIDYSELVQRLHPQGVMFAIQEGIPEIVH